MAKLRGGPQILLREQKSLLYLDGHEVFSAVTGGRAPLFSRLGYGGNRSPEPVEGNAEGAKIPRKQVAEKTSPGALEQRKRPHDRHTRLCSVQNDKMVSSVTTLK